jgi:hypothetical protein
MKAVLLFRIGDLLANPKPLALADVPDPEPNITEGFGGSENLT